MKSKLSLFYNIFLKTLSRRKFNVLNLALSFVLTACGFNLLNDFADKNTNDAKLKSAKMSMNDKDYATAINYLNSLSPDYLAQRSVQALYASAFSGRCGLDFVDMSTRISGLTGSNLFLNLMQLFPGKTTTDLGYCQTSETTLKNIGDESVRTVDENLLMTFSSMVKMGVALSAYADTNADTIVDPTFDHCTTITDAHMREIASGIALTVLSLTAAGVTIGGGVTTGLSNVCALDPSLAPLCTSTDPTSYSPTLIQALRMAVGSSDYGLNASTCAATFGTPGCICP